MFQCCSKDVTTTIFSYLSSQERAALLAAFPEIATKIDWGAMYHQKYNPLAFELRKICNDHFPIRKKERLEKMLEYYLATDITRDLYDDNEYYDTDYDYRNIPIIDTFTYKVEDYEASVRDYIYDDIRKVKKNFHSTVECQMEVRPPLQK